MTRRDFFTSLIAIPSLLSLKGVFGGEPRARRGFAVETPATVNSGFEDIVTGSVFIEKDDDGTGGWVGLQTKNRTTGKVTDWLNHFDGSRYKGWMRVTKVYSRPTKEA